MGEKLFKEHKTSKYNQMMYVNGLSAIVSLFTLISTGTLMPAFGFFFTKPQFALDSAVLSASAVGGQFFIYSQVKEFGALVFAATTRPCRCLDLPPSSGPCSTRASLVMPRRRQR